MSNVTADLEEQQTATEDMETESSAEEVVSSDENVRELSEAEAETEESEEEGAEEGEEEEESEEEEEDVDIVNVTGGDEEAEEEEEDDVEVVNVTGGDEVKDAAEGMYQRGKKSSTKEVGKIRSFFRSWGRKNTRATDAFNTDEYKQASRWERFKFTVSNPIARLRATTQSNKEDAEKRKKRAAFIDKIAEVESRSGGMFTDAAEYDPDKQGGSGGAKDRLAGTGGGGGERPNAAMSKKLPAPAGVAGPAGTGIGFLATAGSQMSKASAHADTLTGLGEKVTKIAPMLGLGDKAEGLPGFIKPATDFMKGNSEILGKVGSKMTNIAGPIGTGLSGLGSVNDMYNQGREQQYSDAIGDKVGSRIAKANMLQSGAKAVAAEASLASFIDPTGTSYAVKSIANLAGNVAGTTAGVMQAHEGRKTASRMKKYKKRYKKGISRDRTELDMARKGDIFVTDEEKAQLQKHLFRQKMLMSSSRGFGATGAANAWRGSGKAIASILGGIGNMMALGTNIGGGFNKASGLAGTTAETVTELMGSAVTFVTDKIAKSKEKKAAAKNIQLHFDLDNNIARVMEKYAEYNLTRHEAKHIVLKAYGAKSGKRSEMGKLLVNKQVGFIMDAIGDSSEEGKEVQELLQQAGISTEDTKPEFIFRKLGMDLKDTTFQKQVMADREKQLPNFVTTKYKEEEAAKAEKAAQKKQAKDAAKAAKAAKEQAKKQAKEAAKAEKARKKREKALADEAAAVVKKRKK